MSFIAETKEQVRAWFDSHPDAREAVESTEFQFRLWRPEYGHDDYIRMMTVDDVRYVAQGGWRGEPGVFAWYYPCGVPTYMCVEEPPAIEWPEDVEYHSPETFDQMRRRHGEELASATGDPFAVMARHERELMAAMWDDAFARDAFVCEMLNHEYGYTREDWDVLGAFGRVTSCDYRRGIAELGLPERVCGAYESAAREVMGRG